MTDPAIVRWALAHGLSREQIETIAVKVFMKAFLKK